MTDLTKVEQDQIAAQRAAVGTATQNKIEDLNTNATQLQPAAGTNEQTSEVAENENLNQDESVPEHEHKWRRGMLPGGKYIKTCAVTGCGAMEEIDFAEFSVLV